MIRKIFSYYNSKHLSQLIIISGLVLALDQFSKLLILRYMDLNQSIVIIENIFRLTYVRNTGAAFSILTGWVNLLIPISSLAVIFIIFFYLRLSKDERWMRVALSFVLGGALGNLIDRIAYRSVVDFLDFGWRNFRWATFNFADTFVDVGVAMIIIKIVFFGRKDEQTEEEPEKAHEEVHP